MSHQTADSDGSIRLDWDIAIGFTNRLQFAFTDVNAAAFNVAGYTYSVQAWKPGQSPTTANLLLNYTQGSEITNNGVAGTVDVLMSVADSELFKNNVDVLWRVRAIHPNGDVRRWYNGFIKPSRELHEGTTTGVTQALNVDGVTVNTTVTIAAGGATAAEDISFTPYSTLSATNVQTAIQEVLDEAGSGFTVASLAEAQAGTNNTKGMTPLRVRSVTERVYNVEAYGALHDYQTAYDASITSGTAILTKSAGAFVAADVGKSVRVYGAGAAGVDLLTTILSYQSATQVTLNTNASTTVSAKQVAWATDDTPAFQAAAAAASAVGGGKVYAPVGHYVFAAALVTSVNSINPNCQVYVPLVQVSQVAGTPSNTVNVIFEGETNGPLYGGGLAFVEPTKNGVLIESWITGTGTEPCVFGSSFYNNGFANANDGPVEFHNMIVRVKSKDGTTDIAPTMSAYNCRYAPGVVGVNLKADTESASTTSVEPATTVTGFILPGIQNSGNILLQNCSAERYGTGYLVNEHAVLIQTWASVCVRGFALATSNHASYMDRICVNLCKYGIWLLSAARFQVNQYDSERKRSGTARWYDWTADMGGASSNGAAGFIQSYFIVDSVAGANPSFVDDGNVGVVIQNALLGSHRFFGRGGFRNGAANKASFASYHEYNEGTANSPFVICYSANQATASDGSIAALQFANTNPATAIRIANMAVLTDGATNTGKWSWYTAAAGSLNETIRWRSAQINHLLATYFGSISATPNSLVHTTSLATGYVAKTGAYTLTIADFTVEVTSGTHTQTLPTAVGIPGRIYVITNTGSGTVTVGTTSSQTFINVSGTPTTLALAQFETARVQSNGANWLRI